MLLCARSPTSNIWLEIPEQGAGDGGVVTNPLINFPHGSPRIIGCFLLDPSRQCHDDDDDDDDDEGEEDDDLPVATAAAVDAGDHYNLPA